MNNSGTPDEILRWLDTHGVENKDAAKSSARRPRVKKEKPYQIIRKELRKVVDLHGRTSDEAVYILRTVFDECRRNNVKSLLVIHGVGYNSDPENGPVLKSLVHTMLSREFSMSVKDFRAALPRDGGDGATIVRLR